LSADASLRAVLRISDFYNIIRSDLDPRFGLGLKTLGQDHEQNGSVMLEIKFVRQNVELVKEGLK
jgi:hypothetical protein